MKVHFRMSRMCHLPEVRGRPEPAIPVCLDGPDAPPGIEPEKGRLILIWASIRLLTWGTVSGSASSSAPTDFDGNRNRGGRKPKPDREDPVAVALRGVLSSQLGLKDAKSLCSSDDLPPNAVRDIDA